MRRVRWHLGAALLVCATIAGLAWADRIGNWLPIGEVQQLRVEVNLAEGRVNVYDGDERIRSYVASVGMPGHETPVGRYAITSVVFNPSWVPPAAPWAEGEEPQAPGPKNPMGRVKLNFASAYFIHGTPDTGRLGQPVSHGCVRLSNSNAIDLARLVLAAGGSGVTGGQIDEILSDPDDTRTIGVPRPVPVQVVEG